MYHAKQAKPEKDRKDLQKIATEFGINHNTLNNYFKGVRPISLANRDRQKLSIQKENILVNLIITSANQGIPLTYKDIELYANELIMKIHGPGTPGVGEN